MAYPVTYTDTLAPMKAIRAASHLRQPVTLWIKRVGDSQEHEFTVVTGEPKRYQGEMTIPPLTDGTYPEYSVVAWAADVVTLGLNAVITYDGWDFRAYLSQEEES